MEIRVLKYFPPKMKDEKTRQTDKVCLVFFLAEWVGFEPTCP